jgi:two-component system sensor histidine kinase VicK
VRAEDRITEIGEGIEAEFYEVITDNEKARDVYIDLARSVKNEALLLFANSKAMIRADKIGIIDSLLEASTKKSAIEFEKLKEADKMQKEFIDVAAHELRSPVQPILGLSEVLSSQIMDSQQQEILSAIIRNAKRLQQLTDDILDVTKIGSHALKLKFEQFDLNRTVYDCVQDARNMTEKANGIVKLLYESKEDVIIVEADKRRISRLFLIY